MSFDTNKASPKLYRNDIAAFLSNYFPYIVLISISLLMWSPLLRMSWGMIDDHEIFYLIGTQNNLPFNQFFQALSNTEISQASGLPRFRPIYFSLRILEAIFWGKDPMYWYATRIFIGVFFSLSLYNLLHFLPHKFLSLCFVIYVISNSYFVDIFTRAGPSEIYALIGLGLINFSLANIKFKGINNTNIIIFNIGLVICIGSKENFLVLLLLIPYLYYFNGKKFTAVQNIITIIPIFFSAWISWVLIFRLRQAGVDIYANEFSTASKFKIFIELFKLQVFQAWVLLVLIFCCARKYFINSITPCQSKWFLITSLFLLITYSFQFLFYSGHWPAHAAPRYLLPGILALDLNIFFLIHLCLLLLHSTCKVNVISMLIPLISSLCYLGASEASIIKNRAASKLAVTETNEFKKNLTKISETLTMNPDKVIEINSFNVMNYENIYSLERFLRSAGFTNVFSLRINGYFPEKFQKGSLERQLSNELDDLSKKKIKPGWIPNNSFDGKNCYSISLGGDFNSQCNAGGIKILN